ncbi:MAG: sensor domain-containing diguanylate cyclase, partial [Pseudomonadota bacterium]
MQLPTWAPYLLHCAAQRWAMVINLSDKRQRLRRVIAAGVALITLTGAIVLWAITVQVQTTLHQDRMRTAAGLIGAEVNLRTATLRLLFASGPGGSTTRGMPIRDDGFAELRRDAFGDLAFPSGSRLLWARSDAGVPTRSDEAGPIAELKRLAWQLSETPRADQLISITPGGRLSQQWLLVAIRRDTASQPPGILAATVPLSALVGRDMQTAEMVVRDRSLGTATLRRVEIPIAGTDYALRAGLSVPMPDAQNWVLIAIGTLAIFLVTATAASRFWSRAAPVFAAAELTRTRHLAARDRQSTRAGRMALASEHSNDSLALMDKSGRIAWTNPAFRKLSGHAKLDLLGRDCRDILDRAPLNAGEAVALNAAIENGIAYRAELLNRGADGTTFWTEFDLIPLSSSRDTDADGLTFLTVERDITQRKKDAERLRQANDAVAYRAMHDSLTDLPNRQYLGDHLSAALKNVSGEGGQLGVLHVDLDHFKEINDTMGHAAGDQILQHVARMMRRSLKRSDFVSRVGGDEFIIVA